MTDTALAPIQPAPDEPGPFSPAQVALLQQTIAKDATAADFAWFAQVCQRTGLDPFARQVYLVKRQGRMNVQVSIDGFRLIAERTGKYAGQLGPEWCGPDGLWRDVWLEEKPPAAARVGVLRTDWTAPLWSVARWTSYAQDSPTWKAMPDLMLAKVAEALSLRRAFPQELSGVYSLDEMEQAANRVPPHEPTAPAVPRRLHPVAGAAEDVPLTGEQLAEHFSPTQEEAPVPAPSEHGVPPADQTRDLVRLRAEAKAIAANLRKKGGVFTAPPEDAGVPELRFFCDSYRSEAFGAQPAGARR